MFGTVKEVISFFSRSAKRSHVLREKIELHNKESKVRGLIDLCETRWVERHDAIIRFKMLFETVIQTIESVEEASRDTTTKTRATNLLKAIKSPDFILSLNCAAKILCLSLPLSKALQEPEADLQTCFDLIAGITESILEIKENQETEFHEIFQQATECFEDL